jgi:hypothetical protein
MIELVSTSTWIDDNDCSISISTIDNIFFVLFSLDVYFYAKEQKKKGKINIFLLYSNNVSIDLLEIVQIVIMMYHLQLILYLVIEIYQENLIDIDKHYLKQHNHNPP